MQKTFWIFVVIILAVALCCLPVEGKHTQIRTLSAREVYSLLREADREDAIPEGRYITHGIETDKEPEAKPELNSIRDTGRVLISASALNATTTLLEYMKHLNYTAFLTTFIPTYNLTITKPTFNLTSLSFVQPSYNLTSLKPNFNFTALTSLKPGLNISTLSLGLLTTRSAPKTVQKEICFSSRSLNDIYDDEIETETEAEADGRQSTDTITDTMPTASETSSSQTSPSEANSPDVITTEDDNVEYSPAGYESTGAGTGTASGIGSGTYTGLGSAAYATPLTNQRLGSATITCVVVQRPQTVHTSQTVRRRQSTKRPQTIRRQQSTRRPQNIRRPQNVRRQQNVHRQQNTRRPQNVRSRPQYVQRPQNVRRPQNARKPQNVREGRNA